MEHLDLAIQTLFNEFREQAFHRIKLEHQLKAIPTFVKKQVKGKTYWYRQSTTLQKKTQQYEGPSDPKCDQAILAQREQRQKLQAQIRRLRQRESKQIALLRRSDLPILDSSLSALLEILSQARLVYEGGILVGSLAFSAYAGILGVILEKASLRTQDIDIAWEENLAKLEEPISVIPLLEKKGEFHPVPGLSPKTPASTLMGPQGLRIDFVTAQKGTPGGVHKIPGILDVAAVRLNYLDFLLKETSSAILLGTRSGIPVTVPHPARFAVHKLILSTSRHVSEHSKQKKDLWQASQLIQACGQEMPLELKSAFAEAKARGPKWKRRLEQAINGLSEELREVLMGL